MLADFLGHEQYTNFFKICGSRTVHACPIFKKTIRSAKCFCVFSSVLCLSLDYTVTMGPTYENAKRQTQDKNAIQTNTWSSRR